MEGKSKKLFTFKIENVHTLITKFYHFNTI
nr:MAG TPA: hypothetical protein [Caudoviricetes sp.]DAZ58691.1 MAG TPA: hypothetical protein [Caudoviricetes sp.]